MVIGAGLAGLTAAATAARARKPVVVVEADTAGGRARTDERAATDSTRGRTPSARAARPGGYCATWGCPTAVTGRRCVAPVRARRQAGTASSSSWARWSPGC